MKKTGIIVLAILLVSTSVFSMSFPDVTEDDWFYDPVTELAEKEVLRGYEDGTFQPKGTVTYAEFLTLLNNKLGEPQENGEKEWYDNTFQYLKEKEVIEEIETPDEPISRQEMAKYVSSGLEKLKDIEPNTETPDLTDFDEISSEYRPYVANAANNGIIRGDEDKVFHPEDHLTRAEAAQVIKNLDKVEDTADPKTEKVEIDYGTSETYTKEDMDAAVEKIKEEVAGWEDVTLYSLSYTSDEENNEENLKRLKNFAVKNDYNEDFNQCTKFESRFQTSKDAGGAWEPDFEYHWHFWLVRQDDGEWNLLTWGV